MANIILANQIGDTDMSAAKKPKAGRRKKTVAELTEAEWEIMRVVWEKEPCAAGTVQEVLAPSKGWALDFPPRPNCTWVHPRSA